MVDALEGVDLLRCNTFAKYEADNPELATLWKTTMDVIYGTYPVTRTASRAASVIYEKVAKDKVANNTNPSAETVLTLVFPTSVSLYL